MRGLHHSLLGEMREDLLGELGALHAYPALSKRTRDLELGRILSRFHQDEFEQVRRLREVMISLGARPRRRSHRRHLAAVLLVLSTRLLGLRFALRVCQEAEGSISRSYRELAVQLVRIGEIEQARTCEELSLVKARHAQVLGAWVEHLPARR